MTQKHFCEKCEAHYFYETKSVNAGPLHGSRFQSISFVYSVCPGCGTLHYMLFGDTSGSYILLHDESAAANRKSAPDQVPAPIAADYNEAASVLQASPKASAALARRCLQHMLRERGYIQKDLVQQIEAVLGESDASKALPETLRLALDAVRNFGNFSAHPLTDRTTLQIIDVEPGEAEWCLEILHECFEYFYIRPAILAERRRALNEKLASAGKPPAQ